MRSFATAAALVATASYAFAAPQGASPQANAPKHTFQVVQSPKGKVFINGPTQVVKTHEKYARVGATVPSDAKVAAAAVQSGSVAANPEQYDQSYLCPVSVGGQTLQLDFDTGSADLWVFSTLTPSSQSTGHTLYNPSVSGTKKTGYTWNISYGDGSGAKGTVYGDKVVVGGVTATSQAVEAATSVSAQFTQDTDNDGLLGLAFSNINTVSPQQQTTFFDTVKPTLAKALFAVDLKKGAAGSYQFGYIDSTKYTGSITYTPVTTTSNGFWEFAATGYSVGTSTTTTGTISGSNIADTGTTLLYLPDAVVSAYYAKVSGAKYDSTQGGYTFPSSSTLPNFNVKIGGTLFTVPGSYIKYAPVSSTTYFGGIQSSSGIGFNIFGDIFLKAVYVIFDETTSSPRLGFAKQS